MSDGLNKPSNQSLRPGGAETGADTPGGASQPASPEISSRLSRTPWIGFGSGSGRTAETWVALALTAVIICLHIARAANGGGLWRDEAATAHLADAFSVKYVIRNAQFEVFPLLLPAALHAYGWIAGVSDLALRIFGTLVGIFIIGALWLNMALVRRGVPLLGLALLGFNGDVIQWGDAIRGYGLGILLILLTAGLMWRVVERPSGWRIGAALLGAIGSVQTLFGNSVLLLAIGGGLAALALRRGRQREAGIVMLIGFAAALSLLPYWAPLHHLREWDIVVRTPTSVGDHYGFLNRNLSASSGWGGMVWPGMVLAALVLSGAGQFKRNPLIRAEADRDVLLFSGLALAAGVAGTFCFLETSGYAGAPWYFLGLLGLAATLLDFIFDTLRPHAWARNIRLTLVLFIAGISVFPVWQQVRVRQSNLDLLAARLTQAAAKEDLVVVDPFYLGVSFGRYYRGPAPWLTVPPIQAHEVYRLDLVKSKMMMADQDQVTKPIRDRITETLGRGHRVWWVGWGWYPPPSEAPPPLPPAPNSATGWGSGPYLQTWSQQVAAFLLTHAKRMEDVPIASDRPVNWLENVSLEAFGGMGQ